MDFITTIDSYARSLMTQNSNVVNQVSLEYDINPNLKVGDTVEIDEPGFYIQGKFIFPNIFLPSG